MAQAAIRTDRLSPSRCAASAPVKKTETWTEANAAMLCAVPPTGSRTNAVRCSMSRSCRSVIAVAGNAENRPGSA